MLGRLPSLKLVRLWVVVLLATIGLQTTVDAAPTSTLQKTSGSAFSAATYEVALYVERVDKVRRHVVAPQPLVPLAAAIDGVPMLAAALADNPPACPDSTGPPVREIRSWKAAPRAPPLA
ncbi:MAG TPA: hypothetical protein VF481_05895 [Novosphingobium sp.]